MKKITKTKIKNKPKEEKQKKINNKKIVEIPKTEELEKELKRINYGSKYRSLLKKTIYTLLVVAAIAIILATIYMPVLEITGTSMTPTFEDGNIVMALKKENYRQGDIIAFYYNNKVLVKRIIASYGDWVNIDEDGNVYINNVILDEPYIKGKSYEESNIDYPYLVPDNSYFVLGDDRMDSIDSRNKTIGSVKKENVIGKILFRIWPLKNK